MFDSSELYKFSEQRDKWPYEEWVIVFEGFGGMMGCIVICGTRIVNFELLHLRRILNPPEYCYSRFQIFTGMKI